MSYYKRARVAIEFYVFTDVYKGIRWVFTGVNSSIVLPGFTDLGKDPASTFNIVKLEVMLHICPS